jgi:hypothetical protein
MGNTEQKLENKYTINNNNNNNIDVSCCVELKVYITVYTELLSSLRYTFMTTVSDPY